MKGFVTIRLVGVVLGMEPGALPSRPLLFLQHQTASNRMLNSALGAGEDTVRNVHGPCPGL